MNLNYIKTELDLYENTDLFEHRFRSTWIGKLQPMKADKISSIILDSRTQGTYRHLVSQFRKWVIYCDDFDIDPLDMPPDPYLYIFWIQDRIEASGSIASLDSWTHLMFWLCELAGVPPNYKEHPDVKRYFKAIKKIYSKGKDHRLPFKAAHILAYIKSLKKKNKKRTKLKYDQLVKLTMAQTFFFTMSRPCELLKTTRSDGKTIGLPISNVTWKRDKEHNVEMVELEITSYKNQASKLISKKIWMGSTTCKAEREGIRNKKGERCVCRYLNPSIYLRLMLKERKLMVKQLESTLNSSSIPNKERIKITKKLKTLRVEKESPLFVFESGKVANTTDLRTIAKEICQVNKIMDPQHYTAYSFRIGGTTLASIRQIDHPKILKYVGWASSRLADCAQRYMRYSPFQLAVIPKQMVHGHKDSNYIGIPRQSMGKIYDPWSEQTNFKFYK